MTIQGHEKTVQTLKDPQDPKRPLLDPERLYGNQI